MTNSRLAIVIKLLLVAETYKGAVLAVAQSFILTKNVRIEYIMLSSHSSSSTKQVEFKSFVKPATQLLIMQNHEGHARDRGDCLIISFVFKTNYQGILIC